jgi:hypothetical protein
MSYPGLIPITQSSFAPGATSPRTDAIQRQLDMNQRQNDLNSIAFGGRGSRRHKHSFFAGAQVAVPQFQMPYTPVGSNPNDQVATNAALSMQGKANSVFDQEATKLGGSRRRRRRTKKRTRHSRRRRRNTASRRRHRRR